MGIETLTEREKEILRLLLHPMRTKGIATSLSLSVHTVNDHLKSARGKLGVSDSLSAAQMLRDHEATHPQNVGPTESGWSGADPAEHDDPREGWEAISFPRPFAVKGRPWNRLSLGWRIVWPLLLFGIVALGAGLLIGALASLSQLILSISR